MNARSLRAAAAVSLVLAAAAGVARGEEEESILDRPPDKDAWPTELVRRPLTLAQGMFELTLPVNANMAPGAFGEPVFVNPSLYYGVTPNVTVGVRHFVGLCVTGSSHGCGDVYNDVSVDSIWSFVRGQNTDVALGAALNASHLDPVTLNAEVRVAARYRMGSVAAVTVAPQLNFGLTERDTQATIVGTNATTASGNREVLTIPVTLQVQGTDRLAAAVSTALAGPLDPQVGGFGDAYTIPLAFEADYAVTNMLDLGANFSFTNLAGKNSTSDARFGKVFARARF
jgi:hypothetical protein